MTLKNRLKGFGLFNITLYLCNLAMMLMIIASARGQSLTQDSLQLRVLQQQAAERQLQASKPFIPPYQGREWAPPKERMNGHPLFSTETAKRGSLTYSGYTYPDLYLQYDLNLDQALILPNGNGYWLIMPKEKVTSFSLDGDQFFRAGDRHILQGLENGEFYHVLHDGRFPALAKHRKKMKIIAGTEYRESWVETKTYYLFEGTRYQEIDSEKKLLAVAGKQAPNLKKRLRQQKIRFKKNPAGAIIATSVIMEEKI